jgi:hypothetical protein
MTILLGSLLVLFGIVAGFVGHAWLTKEASASKATLSGWGTRLKTALEADLVAAKVHVQAVITDIEKHL